MERCTRPDLQASLVSPLNTTLFAEHSEKFNFKVTNSGNNSAGAFKVGIYANGVKLATAQVNSLKWSSSVSGTFELSFGESYGKNTIKLVADDLNVISESNESNNTYTKVYDVVYCTHYNSENIKVTKNATALTVRVTSSACMAFSY